MSVESLNVLMRTWPTWRHSHNQNQVRVSWNGLDFALVSGNLAHSARAGTTQLSTLISFGELCAGHQVAISSSLST